MTVATSAGTILSVSAGIPATFNKAGYEALTFTAVGEITDLGEFGLENTLVTHNPIGTRVTQKFKGSQNMGSMALTLGLDNADAGQIIMNAANVSDADYSFKVEIQDGTVYYFQAKVMMFKIGINNVDSITIATSTLELTTNSAGVGIITVAAA